MKKRKSVKQSKLDNDPQSQEANVPCPVSLDFFEELESLLPLLVFAKAGRKQDPRALLVAETLLSLKENVISIGNSQSATIQRSQKVPEQGYALKSQVPEKNAAKSESTNTTLFSNLVLASMEDYLEQTRESIYLGFESVVPSDVQDWVLNWVQKLDETVGDEYLKCITDASLFVEEKWQQWKLAAEKLKPNQGALGIGTKLRALKWSSHATKEKNELVTLKKKLVHDKKSFTNSKIHLEQLSGALTAFLKLQVKPSVGSDKSARRLIALEVEKELHSELKKEIQNKGLDISRLAEIESREVQKIQQKKQTFLQIEDKKMQILVQGFASRVFVENPDLASATLSHLLKAFSPLLEAQEEVDRNHNQFKIFMKTLRKEFQRYREIANEYLEGLNGGGSSSTEDFAGCEPRDALESFGKKAIRSAYLAGSKRN